MINRQFGVTTEIALSPQAALKLRNSADGHREDLSDLASWMSDVQVRPLEGGRVALELPRSAATALGGLLRALATAVEGSPSAPL